MLPIPRYKELSTKRVWSFVKEISELLKYFPELSDDELPDRSYMWTVLSTLKMEEWKKLVEEARKARGQNLEESKESLIEVHPEILEKLLQAPLLPKGIDKSTTVSNFIIIGRGRVGYLLKKSRPAKSERKSAKEYKPTLQILKGLQIGRQNDNEANSSQIEEEKDEDNDMNVDYRAGNRDRDTGESENISNSIGGEARIKRGSYRDHSRRGEF